MFLAETLTCGRYKVQMMDRTGQIFMSTIIMELPRGVQRDYKYFYMRVVALITILQHHIHICLLYTSDAADD